MDESSIRKMLKRLGLRREGQQEPRLPGVAEDGSEAGTTEKPSVDISITPSEKVNDTAEPLGVENPEEVPPRGQLTTVPVGPSIDYDPLNRIGDRTMARLGLLEDAVPLFAEAVTSSLRSILTLSHIQQNCTRQIKISGRHMEDL